MDMRFSLPLKNLLISCHNSLYFLFLENISLEEAVTLLAAEFQKPTKKMDLALISKTQRETIKQRRKCLEKGQEGTVGDLIKKGGDLQQH